MAPPFVLASSSPRRVELLAAVGVQVVVRPPHVDETAAPGEAGAGLALRLARAKAAAVAGPDELVLGADTVVVVDGVELGKPHDDDDVEAMLRRLSGRRHDVVTGVAVLLEGREASAVVTTEVRFRDLTDEDLAWYRATGEGRDKAGGYGIQGAASVFVTSVAGSYANVVGLPVAAVDELCASLGWPLRAFTAAGGRR